jgi:transcriptional regulator with XRE-family HTH domain
MSSSAKVRKNPPGFSARLRLLMQGRGWKSRDVSAATGVSHMTIENWLSDKHQASADDVATVAAAFGWTYDQLYAGVAPADIMNRVAELEAFRGECVRMAAHIVAGARPLDATEEAAPEGIRVLGMQYDNAMAAGQDSAELRKIRAEMLAVTKQDLGRRGFASDDIDELAEVLVGRRIRRAGISRGSVKESASA